MTTKKGEFIFFGSHNTMTYLSPKHWWAYLGLPVARCQRKDYKKQWEAGARVFDLRIYYDMDTRSWGFAHGLIDFETKESVEDVVEWLAHKALIAQEPTYIRIILEKWTCEALCRYFSAWCKSIENHYAYISYVAFIGGNRKGDWKKLHTFVTDIDDHYNNQWVSSMAEDARWYEKAFPFLYALRCNKRNKLKMKEITNLFDFV